MYNIEDKVKVSNLNDNENYNEFRNKTLIITDAEIGGYGYDNSVYPQQLLSFETEQSEDIPFSLYEYEIEFI